MAVERSDPRITNALNAPATSAAARWQRVGPMIHRELLRIATLLLHHLPSSNGQASIEPSDIVSEFYLRILRDEKTAWVDRRHFFAYAAACMRTILIDRRRRRLAARRPPSGCGIALEEDAVCGETVRVPRIEVGIALEKLARMNPRQAAVVTMRFFDGFSFCEIASTIRISEKTVQRDWLIARAWLYAELGGSVARQ